MRRIPSVMLAAIAVAGLASPAPLQARVERSSEARMQWLADIQEIRDVMSRHAWYYSAGQHQRELDELFAMNMPDVSFGTNQGFWVGSKSIQRFYVDWFYIQI